MTSAREQLMEMRHADDPFIFPKEELQPLQLEAARELFAEYRPLIPVLDSRARDAGINEINDFADIVPLLLSHTTYKSYPQSFIQKGQWKHMLQWLGLVSTKTWDHVGVSGIGNIDEFIDCLWAEGLELVTSSGTGGKVSLLPKSKGDNELMREATLRFRRWPNAIKPTNSHHFFALGPIKGAYAGVIAAGYMAEGFGRPDSTHVLVDEPMRIARLSRMAEMRVKMGDGTATPVEIAQFEAEAAEQLEKSRSRLDGLVKKLIEVRHEPVYIQGLAAQCYMFMERARELGMPEGKFHPDGFYQASGGTKHVDLPADFREQMARFYAKAVSKPAYGMSETTWLFPDCEAGNYHVPPFIIPLVLNETGEELLNQGQGKVEGRFAFLDLAPEYRWGGLISSDRLTIDFGGSCACGRKSPNVIPPIGRFDDGAGADKIECSGTIDAYIRGSFA